MGADERRPRQRGGAQIAIDPSSPSTLIAGTFVFPNAIPVFKSIDGGASWVRSDTGITANFAVAIVFDPVTPTTVYAGTGGTPAVWKSTDGGASWTGTGPGLPGVIPSLAIDPGDPSRLYVASNDASDGGLYASTDAGDSWSLTGCTGFGATDVAVRPDDSSVLVVAANRFAYLRRGGIYASDDGGATCTLSSQGITNFSVAGIAVDRHTGTLYLGDSQTAAYRSTDGGATWSEANAGIAGISRLLSNVATDAVTPDTVYVTGGNTLNDRVWKSTDAGATWTVTFGPQPLIHSLATSAAGPGHVFVGSDALAFNSPPTPPIFIPANLQRTTDGGATWIGMNLVSSFLYVSAIAIDPSAPNVVFVGTDQGILKSVDGGATFPQHAGISPGGRIEAIAVDPSSMGAVVYASTRLDTAPPSGLVYKSVDGGASWTPRSAGLPNTAISDLAIDPAVPAVVYAATVEHGVHRSIDAALTWTPFNEGLTTPYVTTLAFDPTRPGRLYVGTLTSSMFMRDVGGCPVTTCGDDIVQGCEQCDDGALNGAPESCCTSDCQYRPAGTACASDGDLCTADACDPTGTCLHQPALATSCATPATRGGTLKIDDRPAPRADAIAFTWGKGPAVEKVDFGTPNAGTAYQLCLFADGPDGLRLVYGGRALPPCRTSPCWKERTSGWKFASTGGPDGVGSIKLKAARAGKSRVEVRSAPAALVVGALPLPPSSSMTAQVRSSGGGCWGATFSSPSHNDGARFRAKSD